MKRYQLGESLRTSRGCSRVTMAVLKFLFSFEGRIGRAWYWAIQILQLSIASVLIPTAVNFKLMGPVVSLAAIGAVIVMYSAMWLANHTKRLHDLGRSGWLTLIYLVPVVGSFYVLIMCGFVRGDVGDNAYGRPFEA
jgi:uncharacterized membrane protein YhaH (DUF805 family)